MSNKLSSVTSTSSGTLQDLTYSVDMMLTLEEAELALSKALMGARVSAERLAEMESWERADSRTNSVVYKRGGTGADTVMVRRVHTTSESDLLVRDPIEVTKNRSKSVSDIGTVSVAGEGAEEETDSFSHTQSVD